MKNRAESESQRKDVDRWVLMITMQSGAEETS
jgi:hypothetical protein